MTVSEKAIMSSGAVRAAPPPGAIAATIIGNGLEFYDFIVYSYFAAMIGREFFPTESAWLSLLLSVGTFGAGFLTRPLGAVVLGAYADHKGRKPAMTLTILLMALGTGMLGLTPSYAMIGPAAPLIVLAARLIQGFSAGGELGPATTYLLESAPPDRRAAYTAWQGASQVFAAIAGALIGFCLSENLSEVALYEWGWRVPFLLGLVIGPVGFYIRRRLPETLAAGRAHGSARAVLADLGRHHSCAVILGVFIICGGTITTYVIHYFTTYALTTLHLSAPVAMLGSLAASLGSLVGLPLGAFWSDRADRRVAVILPRLVFMGLAYPAYVVMGRSGTTTETLLLVNFGLSIFSGISTGGMYALLPEAFPAATRSSGLAILYAVSVTLFGGTAQVAVTWLIEKTGDPLVPAWYLIVANVATVIGVALLKPYPEPVVEPA